MSKIPSQLLKGALEGAILMVIAKGDVYGYALQNKLEALGFGEITEGTIYPLLLKLEKKGEIRGERRASASGPNRKYYRLTTLGEQSLNDFSVSWQQLASAMERLGGSNDESK